MKFKKTIATLLSTILLMGLFATSAFAYMQPVKEGEPNNTQTSASSKSFKYPYYDNLNVYGTCNSNDLQDWYKIRLTDATYPAVIAYSNFTGVPGCTYKYTIYDNNMVEWGHVTSTNASQESLSDFTLAYNVPYYFQVELISGTPTEPYNFSLNVSRVYTSKEGAEISELTQDEIAELTEEVTE